MFRLFLKDLIRQRKRFFLTAMAIGWGTISMVLFLAFGEGLKQGFLEGTRGLGESIIIISGGSTGKAYKGLGTGRRIRLSVEDVDLIQQRIPEIGRISAEYQRWGLEYTYGKATTNSRVSGVFPDFGDMRTHYPATGGRFINTIDVREKRRVIFLGNELKERLFGKNDAIGKYVTVNRIPFLVVGVLQEKIQTSMYSGPDAMGAVMPASTFASLYGYRYVSRIIVQPRRPEDAEFVKSLIKRVLGAKHQFDPTDKRALWIWDVVEQEREVMKVMLGIQMFLGMIGGITLFIAGGGVANMMYVVIRQRTKEIGLKIALGAKKRNILFPFLLESILITLIGGIFGIPVTYLMIKVYAALPIEEYIFRILGVPEISWNIAFGTVIILGLLGLLAGFFPARKAASINPMEALRYE